MGAALVGREQPEQGQAAAPWLAFEKGGRDLGHFRIWANNYVLFES